MPVLETGPETDSPIVLVHSEGDGGEPWAEALREIMPEVDARVLDQVGDDDRHRVDVAIAWQMPRGVYRTLPNLALIQSIGAGVDHVLQDDTRPDHVPIARVVDPFMARAMTHHVVLQILRWHRQLDRFEANRPDRVWPPSFAFDADALQVAILGFGHLGQDLARSLQVLGIAVAGWARSAKTVEGIETYHGVDGLDALLRRSNVVVCLLPLTAETEGILGRDTFDKLPAGSFIVNVGRGGHVADDELIAALDSGRLSAAALDVFREEPLPADHPFWDDRRIYLTPHIASEVNKPTAAKVFAENIRRVRRGEAPTGLVDLGRGY